MDYEITITIPMRKTPKKEIRMKLFNLIAEALENRLSECDDGENSNATLLGIEGSTLMIDDGAGNYAEVCL